MELPGLILAMIATLLIAYAVPAWSSRRYAVATSREDDRFSDHLTLLELRDEALSAHQGPSSRPILATSNVLANAEGTTMSEPISGRSSAPRRTYSGDGQAAREYAALRARRAARISAERPAAQRRLIAAGSGALAVLVSTVLAATGVIGWSWVLLPVGLLAATLALSAVAGERTKRQMEAEDTRIAELRMQLSGETRARRRPSEQPERAADHPRSESDGADRPSLSASDMGAGPTEHEEPLVESVVIEDVEAEEVLPKVSGGEWDFVPLPAPSYAKKPTVKGRQVHADTDIVSVRRVRAAIPGRPAEAAASGAEVNPEATSRPHFKFDLDAVLEQRRAQ